MRITLVCSLFYCQISIWTTIYLGLNFVNLPVDTRRIPLLLCWYQLHFIRFYGMHSITLGVLWIRNANLSKYCWLFSVFYQRQFNEYLFYFFLLLGIYNCPNSQQIFFDMLDIHYSNLKNAFICLYCAFQRRGWNGDDISGGGSRDPPYIHRKDSQN